MMDDVFLDIEELRHMRRLERLSVVPHNQKYDLASHSYFVMMLFFKYCELCGVEPSYQAIKHVMFHDSSEIITGDLPYHVKNHNRITSVNWEEIEDEVVNSSYLEYCDQQALGNMGELQTVLFKIADMLELVYFLREEVVNCGNRNSDLLRVLRKAIEILENYASNSILTEEASEDLKGVLSYAKRLLGRVEYELY